MAKCWVSGINAEIGRVRLIRNVSGRSKWELVREWSRTPTYLGTVGTHKSLLHACGRVLTGSDLMEGITRASAGAVRCER